MSSFWRTNFLDVPNPTIRETGQLSGGRKLTSQKCLKKETSKSGRQKCLRKWEPPKKHPKKQPKINHKKNEITSSFFHMPDKTDDQSGIGSNHQVRGGAHGDTSGQGCVLNVHHAQFATGTQQPRRHERRYTGIRQGERSVYHL